MKRNISILKQTKLWKFLARTWNTGLSTFFPKYNTKRLFEASFGRKLNLKHPVEFNDKIQWLKLNTYYHNDIITKCVDKYRVREYLKEKGMEGMLPKLYGVYTRGEEIEWKKLPKQFVIKCNHGSGYNILCSDKEKVDRNEATSQVNNWLKEDYWKTFAEIQYKYVKKKIIVEEYLGDDIDTYKFYCFNGVPQFLKITSNGGPSNARDYYNNYFDMEWNRLPYRLNGHEYYPGDIEKPESLDKMKEIAEKLSGDFPFVRVDLYDIQGKIYFSELTFIPTGGYMKVEPKGTLKEWGEWLKLPMDANL